MVGFCDDWFLLVAVCGLLLKWFWLLVFIYFLNMVVVIYDCSIDVVLVE